MSRISIQAEGMRHCALELGSFAEKVDNEATVFKDFCFSIK